MESYIKKRIEESIKVKKDLKKDSKLIEEIADEIVNSYNNGGKVVMFGNGGSAAQCVHIAAEFTIRYEMDRPSLEAIALNADISAITAAGNDFGYDKIFERQVESAVKPYDIVIGLSTSGNSTNVLRGLRKAKKIGALTVALVGKDGIYSKLAINHASRKAKEKNTADYIIKVPSKRTSVIQEAHITIGHILCDLVEKKLYGKKK
ncbi:MAG: SIS domain-containing protein [Nanoarchaeota archaeon]|nr:SIS domain-containing protein [Nanoarchaeota archaeon]MCG2717282.1 SIS domain-containing protein [Nanoarchaeota archaeon]